MPIKICTHLTTDSNETVELEHDLQTDSEQLCNSHDKPKTIQTNSQTLNMQMQLMRFKYARW